MTTKPIAPSGAEYQYYGSGVTLTNAGVRGSAGAEHGVVIYGSNVSLVNSGTIIAGNSGVVALRTGTGNSVTNQAGGVIDGRSDNNVNGITFYYNTATVVNAGLIESSANFADAISLFDGGLVSNASTGTLVGAGVYVKAATGTVVNAGKIFGDNYYGGVALLGGGTITNLAGGTIAADGTHYGIKVDGGAGTVTNAGTIDGGGNPAVLLGADTGNRVVVDPTGVFIGGVDGGATTSTLELAAGSGSLSGFGTQFYNFGTLLFDPSSEWTVAANASITSTVIDGFAAGDTIDLTGFTAATTGNLAGGTKLVLTNGGGVHETLTFGASVSSFVVTTGAGISGTDITTLCFCPGTLIRTPGGEVPVEQLGVGDTVVTLGHNTTRIVTWIGTGKVLATRGQRSAATPVIVRKGALADNVPNRDLHVTKAHSLYIDGVLIPVEFLVNHKSIIWDDRAQEVELYHVELDQHDVLFANGAPAESYRDDGNRWLFHNANANWHLPPCEPYAPVLTGGPVVDAAWRRLLDRAGPRNLPPLTDDPDLHLVVDGERVDVAEQQGPIRVFHLLFCPESVVIASRDAAPAELGLARDPRPLGVALRRIAVRRGVKFELLKANDPRLVDGFHDYETTDDLRWTNGSAALPAELFARFRSGGVEIVLTLAGATRYLDDGKSMAAVAAA
jgi:hypothetical protein